MILKNFSTYKGTKSNKRYKLKRFIAGILSPVIIITSLTGCKFNFRNKKNNTNNRNKYSYFDLYDYGYSNSKESNRDYYDYETNTYTTSATEYEESTNLDVQKPSLELDELSNAIIGSNVTLSDSELLNFENYVKSIKVSYPYSDLYGIKNNLSKYYNRTSYSPSGINIFTNNSISADKIYSIVKDNNAKENYPDKKVIPDSELKKICSIIADLINDYIKNNDVDLNLLSEKLLDLRIIKFDEFSYGYYDNEKRTMGFNVDSINKSDEFYKRIVEHETQHLLSYCSRSEIDNSNYSNRSGISYKFSNDDTSVNSLFWVWFNEGAAEYLTMDHNNTNEPGLYETLIKSFDTVKVSTILSDNSLSAFERLSLSSDIEDLFSYFNAETDSDKEEVLNMMYAYEVMLDLNSTSSAKAFYKLYKEKNGDSVNLTDLAKDLKCSIAQTLTKQFYTNLANKCKNSTVSLNEIFSLISIFENELSRGIWYASSGNKDAYTAFYSNYNGIQSSFFEAIANKLNINRDEIQQAYNSYNAKVDADASKLTLVSSDKKDYLGYILETRKDDKMNSVNYVSESFGMEKSR